MRLDLVTNNRRLSDMEGYKEGVDWMTVRYELDPSEYVLLRDGKLNLTFTDEICVDWVKLSWLTRAFDPIPTPSSIVLLGTDSLLLCHRRSNNIRQ